MCGGPGGGQVIVGPGWTLCDDTRTSSHPLGGRSSTHLLLDQTKIRVSPRQ